MSTKVILDTDIGDDIDDVLALALICASPELQLVGVTTVFGPVIARAKQARTVLAVAGEKYKSIPVFAGCSASMAIRPNATKAGELENVPNQDSSCLPEDQLAPLNPKHAVNFLIDTLMAGDGDIIPITIGAMTNLAAAMVLERRIIKKIPRIACMAGEWHRPMAEWNIRCDPEAAHIVFNSGIPVTAIPWEIGHQVQFTESDIQRLGQINRPVAQNLSLAIKAWRADWGTNPMPHLFDPMSIATIIKPDLCIWKRGHVTVELTGTHTHAITMLKEDKDGPHTIAWDAHRDEAVNFYLDRIAKL